MRYRPGVRESRAGRRGNPGCGCVGSARPDRLVDRADDRGAGSRPGDQLRGRVFVRPVGRAGGQLDRVGVGRRVGHGAGAGCRTAPGRAIGQREVDSSGWIGWQRARGLGFSFCSSLIPGLPDDLLCFVAGLTTLPLRVLWPMAAIARIPGWWPRFGWAPARSRYPGLCGPASASWGWWSWFFSGGTAMHGRRRSWRGSAGAAGGRHAACMRCRDVACYVSTGRKQPKWGVHPAAKMCYHECTTRRRRWNSQS